MNIPIFAFKLIKGSGVKGVERAGINAGGFLSLLQAVNAQGAHLHFVIAPAGKLRHRIGTGIFAGAAGVTSQARLAVDRHNAVFRPLLDCLDRAGFGAGGLGAMAAGQGNIGKLHAGINACFGFDQAAPGNLRILNIMLVTAGNHAGIAARAARLIKIKSDLHNFLSPWSREVLLSGFKF